MSERPRSFKSAINASAREKSMASGRSQQLLALKPPARTSFAPQALRASSVRSLSTFEYRAMW